MTLRNGKGRHRGALRVAAGRGSVGPTGGTPMRWIIAGLLALGTGTAVAGPSVEGTFVAQRPCEAVRSIRTGVNPGDVRLTPGGRYEARLLSRVRIPSEVANELRGCDVWKEV